jgi:hypothetical protein
MPMPKRIDSTARTWPSASLKSASSSVVANASCAGSQARRSSEAVSVRIEVVFGLSKLRPCPRIQFASRPPPPFDPGQLHA